MVWSWRDDVIIDGQVERRQQCRKLAPRSDRYRTKRDVQPLLDEILAPLNSGKAQPESTLPVATFVEDYYLPWVRENLKPSTVAGYEARWNDYLAPHLQKISLRDFRTVDAAKMLAEIHRARNLGKSLLANCKNFLSGVFVFAKNQGAFDGINPVTDARVPIKAHAPSKTRAASLEDVRAILGALETTRAGDRNITKQQRIKARAAVALVYFSALRP